MILKKSMQLDTFRFIYKIDNPIWMFILQYSFCIYLFNSIFLMSMIACNFIYSTFVWNFHFRKFLVSVNLFSVATSCIKTILGSHYFTRHIQMALTNHLILRSRHTSQASCCLAYYCLELYIRISIIRT